MLSSFIADEQIVSIKEVRFELLLICDRHIYLKS